MADGKALGRLQPSNVAFLMCDLQEKFRDVIFGMPQVLVAAKALVQGAEIFDIPLLVTEQYPERLGHTVPELDVSKAKVFAKTKFSMCTNEFISELEGTKRKAVVLFGIETHVCMQQTALDLLHAGYQVHVVADCASSQRQLDKDIALERLRHAGCFITTAESVLFELLRSKDAPEFKAVSGVAKTYGEGIRQLQSNM
eukprot:TRINITY_DN13909_c3_g1_i1.p1 TRINITY_DN13909_c3_g1~~TRINITY_DN13909_c3_g1_i1.p1  ORF type:complete len:198 (-),score=37.27 TRINITY_DN13909_c3_g1_i1:108-701(-)